MKKQPKIVSNIGQLLHDQRVKLNLTLEDLSYLTGLSKYTIHRWERKFCNPTLANLALICEILEIENLPIKELCED